MIPAFQRAPPEAHWRNLINEDGLNAVWPSPPTAPTTAPRTTPLFRVHAELPHVSSSCNIKPATEHTYNGKSKPIRIIFPFLVIQDLDAQMDSDIRFRFCWFVIPMTFKLSGDSREAKGEH